jgi:hypothetical protein
MIYLGIAFLAAALCGVLVRSIVGSIIIGVIMGGLAYRELPVLAWNFSDLWLFAFITTCMSAFVAWDYRTNRYDARRGIIPFAALVAILCTGFVLIFVTSSPVFHDAERRNLISVKQGPHVDFVSGMELIDPSKVRILDEALARKRAEQLLGEVSGLASRVKLGTFALQHAEGKLQWVAPLEHVGFRAWMSNDTTPGYVKINASNIDDAHLVREINGKPIALRYLRSAFGREWLDRHIYTNGYATVGVTDYNFEIDDRGNPFWVATRYIKRVGFSGEDATGVVIVDPQTGSMKDYDLTEIPTWVDRVHPAEFVENQINDWGEYVLGWWNAIWNKQDVMKATPGIALVYSKDGNHSSWYSGMQSVHKDTGTMGFVLVDTRTKNAVFYSIAGISEVGAKDAIRGAVSQMRGWSVTDPILYNVGGHATYIATLKDEGNNFKGIGIVSVSSSDVTVTGSNLADALRKYETALANKGTGLITANTAQYVFEGKVVRINVETAQDNTYYYFTMDTVPNKSFSVAMVRNKEEILLTKVGDAIRVISDDTEPPSIRVVEFDNLGLKFEKTPPIGKRLDLAK